MDLAGRLSMRQMKEDWEKNDPNAVRRIVDSQGRTHKVMNRECSVCFVMIVCLFVSMLAYLFVTLKHALHACRGSAHLRCVCQRKRFFLTQGCIPCCPYTTDFAVSS
jgi:hypothetical protein